MKGDWPSGELESTDLLIDSADDGWGRGAVEREGFLVGHLEAGWFDFEGLLEDDMRHSDDSL